MDISEIVNVASRAWALPILNCLHGGVPGRQAPLLAATGAGRTAFAQSIGHLIEIGLVERNPGHGHPLRPEFRLTEAGKAARDYAYWTLNWQTAISLVADGNDGSARVAQRLGCREDGRFTHVRFGTMTIWRHPGPETSA